jgi:hypothetical protein
MSVGQTCRFAFRRLASPTWNLCQRSRAALPGAEVKSRPPGTETRNEDEDEKFRGT